MSNIKKIPTALFSSDKTPLFLGGGEIELPCYVLDNKKRVLSLNGMQKALGFKGSSGDWLRRIITTNDFPNEINAGINEPLKFNRIGAGGSLPDTYGYEATLFIDICNSFIDKKNAGLLKSKYLFVAERADIIVRASAKVGIIALVDEATGYQEYRAKTELREYFAKFLLDEFGKWTKRFPDEFFEMIFRMKGWTWNYASSKKPGVVGHYINNFVYARIAPGILSELKSRTPKDEKGNRKSKFHQWFNEDVGHPKLQEHLAAVIALGKSVNYNWRNFHRVINRALPKYDGHSLELGFPDEDID